LKILNKTKNTVIAHKGTIADTFFSRLVGLLNRSSLSPKEALIITRCNSIHMFFMRFSIDVIFINKEDCVVGLVEGIKPFHLSPIYFKSTYAIELAEGIITQSQTSLGDEIEIIN
jgi:uncharacterized protein